MGYFISAITIMLATFKKRSKIIGVALFILLWILYGLNYMNPDYINYKNTYDVVLQQSGGEISEGGFIFLLKIFSYFNIKYQVFLLCISFAGLFLIVNTLWKFSSYPNLSILFYFIFPFSIDVVQLRFFLAMSIIVFSIRYLILFSNDKKIVRILQFILCIAAASSIHYSAMLFCVMIIPCVSFRKNSFVMPLFLIIVTSFLIFKIDIIIPLAGKYLSIAKIEKWVISDTTKSITMYIRIFIIRYSWLAICFLSFITQQRNSSNIKHFKENKCIFNIILCLTALVPLEMFVNTEYERLSRISLILGYILITRCKNTKIQYTYILWIITFIYLCVYFWFSMTFRYVIKGEISWFEGVFRAVFENNMIFSQ